MHLMKKDSRVWIDNYGDNSGGRLSKVMLRAGAGFNLCADVLTHHTAAATPHRGLLILNEMETKVCLCWNPSCFMEQSVEIPHGFQQEFNIATWRF